MPAANDVAIPVLELQNLCVQLQHDEAAPPIVNDVSLTLHQGKILGLVGESGSGKSMTGLSIMGLLHSALSVGSGRILFCGQDITYLSQKERRSLQGNRMAMIFQDASSTLNPVLRIDEQMIEAILAHQKVSKSQAREMACNALKMMGITDPEKRLKSYPHQLSGGMRQRIVIAVALLHQPDLIIADEPTTALDVTIQAQILSEVQSLVAHSGASLIWVSHDISVVASLADEVAVMYAGRIVEHGNIDSVLNHPQHPYTQGLIDSLPAHAIKGVPIKQLPVASGHFAQAGQGCAFACRCCFRHAKCIEAPPWHACADSPEHRVLCHLYAEDQ